MLTPEASGPVLEDELVACVREALARIESGATLDLDAICGGRGELIAAVREALALEPDTASLQRSAHEFDAWTGRVLAGRYRLGARIGTGAMGTVYAAIDRELDREVAVKIFDGSADARPEAHARFLREAELLARLQHPNVVAVHDRGTGEGGLEFLVMDRLAGVPLSAVLAAHDEDPAADLRRLALLWSHGEAHAPPEPTLLRQIVRWARDVALGLHAAHERGVFHRDVKPSNIFVLDDHRAVLLDFGIATRPDDGMPTLSHSALGTPWYMAPEQALHGVRATRTLDVYGLCATLYHLLTRRPPIEGDAARVLALLPIEDPTPIGTLRPDLPRDLRAIVERGMERDPMRRYATAQDLAADLGAFLDHRPVTARPLTRLGRLWRRVERRPAKALAIAATASAVAAAALAVPLWIESDANARARERHELFARLPALLAVEGLPDQRLLVDLSEQRESLGVLDRLVELAPDDLPSRLLRAALRSDAGEHALAATDLQAIASRFAHSPYLAAIAARYLAADPATRGTIAVDLAGLPEPATAEECYVAGFHELRNRHLDGFDERADALLARAAPGYPPARDLRLIALVARAERGGGRAAAQLAHDESLVLEGVYGAPTARTLAIRGAALVMLERYADAVDPLERANALRAGRHGPLNNLAVAYRRLGRVDDALRCAEQAIALRPQFWNSHYTKAQIELDRGDFATARATARAMPDDSADGSRWRRRELLGKIATVEAISHVRADRDAERNACASEAVAEFEQAIAVAPPRVARALRVRQAIAQALGGDDRQTAASGVLNLIRLEPTDPHQVGNLASLLPAKGLDAESTWLLRLYLRELAIALGSADSAFAERQRAELARDKQRPPAAGASAASPPAGATPANDTPATGTPATGPPASRDGKD